MQPKYIFMTGGVCSGLGKGITAASLGRLLKSRGHKVTIQKFDPYINMNPGLLSPYQHGEVFVTDDGAEVDLDLGHYERFIDENLSGNNSVSAGKVYWEVLNNELNGEYKGATIQVIPHITDVIKSRIRRAASNYDIVISEIGGTVGDIESLPFLEAIRQILHDEGHSNVMYIHVTLVPFLTFAEEMKTKPSQHSVKELLSLGIKPDALVCRTEQPLPEDMRQKMALFCNVDQNCIIENLNVDSIYELPLLFEEEHFADVVVKRLKLPENPPNLTEWINLVEKEKKITRQITVALVGKYTELKDAYYSVCEALRHAGLTQEVNVNLKWVPAKGLTDKNVGNRLKGVEGIIIPSGYGKRGIDGIIVAARYAREQKIPFFGIGLGMQCAMVEFARNVMGKTEATTTEVDPKTTMPIIEHIHPYTEEEAAKGQMKMRLGAYECTLATGTILQAAYKADIISERFRHMCKANNKYRGEFVKHGLIEAATSQDGEHLEAIELSKDHHPWFVAVQFRPEFKSRITRPSPIFTAFVGACM